SSVCLSLQSPYWCCSTSAARCGWYRPTPNERLTYRKFPATYSYNASNLSRSEVRPAVSSVAFLRIAAVGIRCGRSSVPYQRPTSAQLANVVRRTADGSGSGDFFLDLCSPLGSSSRAVLVCVLCQR